MLSNPFCQKFTSSRGCSPVTMHFSMKALAALWSLIVYQGIKLIDSKIEFSDNDKSWPKCWNSQIIGKLCIAGNALTMRFSDYNVNSNRFIKKLLLGVQSFLYIGWLELSSFCQTIEKYFQSLRTCVMMLTDFDRNTTSNCGLQKNSGINISFKFILMNWASSSPLGLVG